MLLEHGPGRLLDLQEQRVLSITPLEEEDEAARAHTAHPDDLDRDVLQAVLLDQVLDLIGHGLLVVFEALQQHFVELVAKRLVR